MPQKWECHWAADLGRINLILIWQNGIFKAKTDEDDVTGRQIQNNLFIICTAFPQKGRSLLHDLAAVESFIGHQTISNKLFYLSGFIHILIFEKCLFETEFPSSLMRWCLYSVSETAL